MKRPILIGGLGLSAGLWFLNSLHFNPFDSSTLLSVIAVGSGVWWWQKRRSPSKPMSFGPPAPPDRSQVLQAIDQVSALIDALAKETSASASMAAASPATDSLTTDADADAGIGNGAWQATLETFRQQRKELLQELQRSRLRLGLMGEKGVGKTTLLKGLALEATQTQAAHLDLLDLDEFSDQSADWDERLVRQDAVAVITAGDLTDSSYQLLRQAVTAGQAIILVFNKQDHFPPADRDRILQQLQRRAAELPVPLEVMAIAADPAPVRVRKLQADGSMQEHIEPASPNFGDLSQALEQITQQVAPLVLTTTQRQVEGWRQSVQAALNDVHRARALPVVEQLQWVAGASALAIPVASLDLLAAAAINGQLLMDLGAIYGLSWSVDEAKAIAASLAELTVKLGIVELSTQVLAAALKGHPATYLAGGALQGLSAAYLTRMVGLSLIETFEEAALQGRNGAALSPETLVQRLQGLLQTNRQGRFIQTLIEQGLNRLRPAPTSSLQPSASS